MKKRYMSYAGAAALFAALILYSARAREGAARGLALWAGLLVPSLLPCFVAAGLLMRLGFVAALGRRVSPLAGRLLGVSEAGCGVLALGLSGGYPLGAASAAEAVRAGTLTRREAESLLFFCDNTGPAFAVGALGTAVFGSAAAGLWLWCVHAVSALLLGVFRRRSRTGGAAVSVPLPLPASGALTASVSAAVNALLSIGGYVVFFSAVLAVADALGFPGALAETAAAHTGLSAGFVRALLTGILELSSGVGAMAGLPMTAQNLALGSFLLGWGGVCVHLQAAAVTADAGLSLGLRLRGKLCHAALSAAITYVAARLVL